MADIFLTNTLTRKKEKFTPFATQVKLYTCGPTVYHFAHIGNLRNVIFNDILRRTLEFNSLEVNHVMNITDVGHLASDADEGEDKLEKGAARENKTVWQVAEFYTDAFKRHTAALNILPSKKLIKATSMIKEQAAMVQTLVEKGFAYQTSEAIYFDVTKVFDYGKLSGQKLGDKEVGARAEVVTDKNKHHPQDFALWFFTVGRFKDHQMHWPSPWGEGFPGWHLECSAIIHESLGEPIDIHTGGVDHIGTHHTNEIAQSESAFDKPLAKFWLHNEFLQLDGDKMAKSGGGVLTLEDLISKGINPLAFRYLCLTAHYRSKMNFTWESLQAAETTLKNLYREVSAYGNSAEEGSKEHEDKFLASINNDLDTPAAVAVVWDLVKSDLPSGVKLNSLLKFDKVLGLGLEKVSEREVPNEVHELVNQREKAREDKDFTKSDELRKQIAEAGYEVVDEESGQKLKKIV